MLVWYSLLTVYISTGPLRYEQAFDRRLADLLRRRSGPTAQRFSKITRLVYTWNEVTILWNKVTIGGTK